MARDPFFDDATLRVGSRSYEIRESTLHVSDQNGRVLRSTPVPANEMTPDWRQVVDSCWSSNAGKTSDRFPCPEFPWHLIFDESRQRIVASNSMMPAWVMAADLEGNVKWLVLTGPECCNFACILGDQGRILHGSSCGRRITVLSNDGRILSQSSLPFEWWSRSFIADGRNGACFLTAEWLVRFDSNGNLTWKIKNHLELSPYPSTEAVRDLIKRGWQDWDASRRNRSEMPPSTHQNFPWLP